MGLRCFGWGWEIGLYNYRGSLLSLMFVMLSLATNKSTSCIAAMVAVPKQTHLPSNDRQNLTKSLWKPGEHDWTLWCNTATTCVGNGHYPVHYWAESDHWKKVSQIWWRCSIMLVFYISSLLMILRGHCSTWLTMWAAYHFEKNRSSVKNVQIPTLQLEGARSSDKPLPMQIQCKYVCRPTHACVTVPSALLCKSYSALLRLKYIPLICTHQCTYLLQRQ